MKSKANVNVYLLLMKEGKLLLSLRENTGYEDNKWSLVSGHQEEEESALYAMIREAKEEINIDVKESDLQVVHTMHRRTDRENIDIFIKCSNWQGEINNNEPEKCGGLEFHSIDVLPTNIIGYIKEAIQMINSKMIYSEFGWKKQLQPT
ncbi:MAG: hypothetical protein S4CHLAM20_00990 [Chlamydiia bacterium]|nr:hypothetical protein [Chlamydiia bacterium]